MGMIKGQWLPLARVFDRLEVRLRRLDLRIKARWNCSSTPAKVLVILAFVAALACIIYLLFG